MRDGESGPELQGGHVHEDELVLKVGVGVVHLDFDS